MNSWSEDNIRDKDTGEVPGKFDEVPNVIETIMIDRQQKHIEKQNRQQIKLQCLSLVNRDGCTAAEIVTAAKAFYAFVRT